MNFTQKWNIKFRDTFLILNLIVAFTVLGYLEISENKIKLAKEDKEFFFFFVRLILSLLGVILLQKFNTFYRKETF